MALKSDRNEAATDISFFYNTAVATRGGVVVLDTTNASGAAMDQGVNLVKYAAATTSSVPVGILMNDVVNKDLTRTHLNQHKDEVQLGGKVTLLTQGWVLTSNITGSPTAGNLAYACQITAGNIDTSGHGGDSTVKTVIGRFMSKKDTDGYAKVFINLPNTNV